MELLLSVLFIILLFILVDRCHKIKRNKELRIQRKEKKKYYRQMRSYNLFSDSSDSEDYD
jgi:hypothetical protein